MQMSALLSARNFLAILSIAFPLTGFSQTTATLAQKSRPELGYAPKAPAGLPLNAPGPAAGGARTEAFQAPVTGGFAVNTDSREETRQFYNAIFPTSDNVPQDSTADAVNGACTPGHNSDAFQQAELRRINWFRAMAGLPASIYLDPIDDWGSQQMAVIITANNALNHNPPTNYACYNTFAAHYAGGDQSLGADGAQATTDFIWDFGAKNNEVGHRRWLLYPQEIVMGVGDVPGSGTNATGNLTYVFDPLSFGTRPATRQPYVSWPPEGYVPYQVVYPYWSFGLSNANFSGATVSMKSNGIPVSVAIQPYQTGFGENTLVWVPMGLDATTEGTSFPFDGADTVYSVTVGNITNNGHVTQYSYTVTVINPATAGADYIPTTLSGPSQIPAGAGAIFSATPPNNPHVTSYNFLTAQLIDGDLADDGGNGLENFTLTPGPNYSATTTEPFGSGPCFNLEHADTNSFPQLLQFKEEVIPAANASLSFQSELGFATPQEVARVQISADGGANWTDLFTEPGNNSYESSFTPHTLSLASYAGQTVSLRFNFDFQGGSYDDGGFPIGWFFTGIVLTNVQALTNESTNYSSSTNIVSGDLDDSALYGLTNFTMTPPPYYYVTTNPPVGSEPFCFHLTHLDSTSQFLQLNETLLPTASSSVSFSSQLGYATSDETARVQVSTNDGATWDDLFVEAGSNGSGETSFTPHTLSLAGYAGELTLLRFNYAYTGGGYYPMSDNFVGWNIEDVLITNTEQQSVTIFDTTNFTFAPAQTGTYVMQAQPVIYSQFPLAFGPVKTITATVNTTPSFVMSDPVMLAAGHVKLNFNVANIVNIGPSTFKLLQADALPGPWVTNASATFATNTAGSSYRFTTTNGPTERYYRVLKP